MPQVVYCNGGYRLRGDAKVSFEDRGFQFADGIYEVLWLENGILIDLPEHLKRLRQSGRELKITLPDEATLTHIAYETARRNLVKRGGFYIQVSRGTTLRNHSLPTHCSPSIVMAVYGMDIPPLEPHNIHTIPDFRWSHCHIKSTALLASVMAASNAWIVTKDDTIITAPLSNRILSGITRQRILKVIKKLGLKHKQEYFTLSQALNAKEAFYTSTTRFVQSVGKINGKPIGNGDGNDNHIGKGNDNDNGNDKGNRNGKGNGNDKGKAGEITTALYKGYLDYLNINE